MTRFTIGLLLATLLVCHLQVPVAAQVAGPPVVTYGYHWVNFQGRDIEVYGFKNASGAVEWFPDAPQNARPRERRSKPVDGPNVPRPEVKAPSNQDWRTNGVSASRVVKPPGTYTATSKEAAAFVAEAIDGAVEPKLHVTIIGSDDEQARVKNDILTNPAFADLRDSLLVQTYGPKDWPVDSALGFRSGRPAIYVEAGRSGGDARGGRVIFRTLDYSIGAAGLAEGIRKNRGPYDDDKAPSPTNPAVPPLGIGPDTAPYLLMAGAFVMLLLFLPAKKGK